MLLSNLTASSAACSSLLSLKISVIPDSRLPNGVYAVDSRSASCPAPVPYPTGESIQVPALPLLVDAFVQGATIGDIKDLSKRRRKGELHFLANVFANLTVVSAFWLSFSLFFFLTKLSVTYWTELLPFSTTH